MLKLTTSCCRRTQNESNSFPEQPIELRCRVIYQLCRWFDWYHLVLQVSVDMAQLSRLLLLVFTSVINVSSAAPAGFRVLHPDLQKNRTPTMLRGAAGTFQRVLHGSRSSPWPTGQLRSWTPVQRESQLGLYHSPQIQSRQPRLQQRTFGFRVPLIRLGLDQKKNGGRIQPSRTNRIGPSWSQGLNIGGAGKPKPPNLQVNIFIPVQAVTIYSRKDPRKHQGTLTPAGKIQTNWQPGPESDPTRSERLWTPGDVVQQSQHQGHRPTQPRYPENKPPTSLGLQDQPAPSPRPGTVEEPRQFVPSFPNPSLLNRYISKPAVSQHHGELHTVPQYPPQVHHPQPLEQDHRVHTNTGVRPSGPRPWQPVTLDLHSLPGLTDFSPKVQNQDSVPAPKPVEPEPAPPRYQHPGFISRPSSLGPHQLDSGRTGHGDLSSSDSPGTLNPNPEHQTPPRLHGLGRRPTYTKLVLDVDHGVDRVLGPDDVPHERSSTVNDPLVHGSFPRSSGSQYRRPEGGTEHS
ncbi:uncharacterized protein LOC103379613 [Cynoglossus semilaevis]|uniref:uncharacterized protein LOC103379613 n=1 Tax=Cynoglossus semilaevis TaxID=244447 RepID=UPI000496F18F|nr:uncharacterized protein LOC103379613 [Cynoglossus semilaevis]